MHRPTWTRQIRSLLGRGPAWAAALSLVALAGCNGGESVEDAGVEEGTSMDGDAGDVGGDLPPEMTSLPSVEPLTETLIRLTWDAGTDDVTASDELTYHVYRATTADGIDFSMPPSIVVPAGETTAEVVGLSPTQENFFVVRAVDGAAQESENTEAVSGATPDLTAPEFGGLESLVPNDQGGLDATWVAATDNVSQADAIEYDLYLDTAPQPQNDPANLVATVTGATSFTLDAPPLLEVQQYFGVVRARDAAGNDDGNVLAQLATTLDVTAPSFGGVSDTAVVKGGIVELSWEAGSDTVTSTENLVYAVYGQAGAEVTDFTAPVLTLPGATTYDFNVGTTDTEYAFVVRARDEAGNESGNAELVTATTGASLDGTPPVMGSVLLVETLSATELGLAWDHATDDHPGGTTDVSLMVYGAWYATAPDGHDFTQPPAATVTGLQGMTLSGLIPDTIYYVVVRAQDEAGNWSENTAPQSGLTDPDTTPPDCSAISLTAAGASSTSNLLEWNRANDVVTPADAMVYRVYRAASPVDVYSGMPIAVFTGSGAATESYLDQGLQPEEVWYYGVRAVDGYNLVCDNEEVASATTLVDSTAPTFAGIASATGTDETSVAVQWPEITADDVYTHDDMVYVIYWGAAGSVFSSPAGTQLSPQGAVSDTVTGLQPSQQYVFGVRARDPYGNEDGNTVEASATTLADTDAPSVPVASMTTTSTTASLTWIASSDPKDVTAQGDLTYEICGGACLLDNQDACPDVASLTSSCDWYLTNPVTGAFEPTLTQVPTAGATDYLFDNIEPGSKIYYQVRACDASANCSAWGTWLFGSTSLDANPPTEGILLTADPTGPATMTVTWSAGSDDVSGTSLAYRVFAVPTGQAFDTNATPNLGPTANNPTPLEGEVTGLVRDTTYDLLVQSQDLAGNWSLNTTSQISATTLADTTPPDPTAVSGAAEAGCTAVDVTFDLSEDDGIPSDQIVYEICASDVSNGCDGAAFDGNIVGTTTGHDVAQGTHTEQVTVANSGTWYVSVRAQDDAGNTSAGSAAVGVTLTDSVGPTFLGPVTVVKDTGPDWAAKLTASWVAATDACADDASLTYEVCLDDDPNEPTIDCVNNFTALAPASTALTLSVEDPVIDSYTRYWMYVRALDPSGNPSVVQVDFATSGVSYVNDIEPIFSQTVDPIEGSCAATCHASLPDVTDYWSIDNVRDVTSLCNPAFKRVAPGDPCSSLVWLLTQPDGAISCKGDTVGWPTGCPANAGATYQMPQFGPYIQSVQDTIYWWIDEGAHNN